MIEAHHLYIIGTAHTLQCGSRGTDATRFERELRRACETHAVARIAEEMSRDGLAHQEVECTIGAGVAVLLGIEHQIVDLERAERESLSLGDGAMLNIVLNHEFPDGGKSFRQAFNVLGVWAAETRVVTNNAM